MSLTLLRPITAHCGPNGTGVGSEVDLTGSNPGDGRSHGSPESFGRVLAHPDGVGYGRERRVHRADAGEKAGVDDVEVVEVMGLAVDVRDRRSRARYRSGRCRPGGRRRR